MGHYPSLYAAYVVAVLGWVMCWRLRPVLWPPDERFQFKRPWLEVCLAVLAAVGVIAVGQIYVNVWRLPSEGIAGPVLESINQIAIFSPMLILLAVRKQPVESAWIRRDHLQWRLPIGFGLALAALLVYSLVREGGHPWWRIVANVYTYENLPHAVQVFLEDVTIAILVVRFRALLGPVVTVVLVACLFAAGHIPTLIAEGASFAELESLVADAVLGVIVIGAAMRSRDIWWLWCVHFAMDMTQFARASGVGS